MPSVTEKEARCRVFTFKEGLLSAVAHDLEIDVTRLRIEWPEDRSKVRATFDARSLRVLHPVANGRPAPQALSDRDRRKIEQNIVEDVLHAARHPEIIVEGTLAWTEPDRRARLEGTLTLAGRSRPLRLEVTRVDEEWRAETTIHQPDFGIVPYSAMLGTLKIRPELRVELRIPFERPLERPLERLVSRRGSVNKNAKDTWIAVANQGGFVLQQGFVRASRFGTRVKEDARPISRYAGTLSWPKYAELAQVR